ncbi:O-antigen ligase family protein, partial [Pseudoalteromonas sp. TAE56]|uniref:O-antigen ligase family protein n=1 Tax=Pseudoalteromonas sp. TAE56 TaxID=1938596 RepID=UPI000467303E
LIKSKSLGATVTTLLVVSLSLFFIVYQKINLTRLIRSNLNWLMILLLLSLIAAIVYIGNSSQFDNFMYEVGKDPTLTGRTFIWLRGIENIHDNPILGTGYESIFYVGNPLAEEIWEFAHVPSGAGFHFHNMYIDMTVQLGMLGGLIFLILLAAFFRSFINNKNLKFGNKEGFALMIFLFMFMQTFLEAGWFSQFTISHFVTCAAWVYLKQTTELKSIKLRWNV